MQCQACVMLQELQLFGLTILHIAKIKYALQKSNLQSCTDADP
jgi:hypothetical protein